MIIVEDFDEFSQEFPGLSLGESNYVNYVCIKCQHKTYTNCLINLVHNHSMELQCGCHVDEIGGVLLVECKPHRQGKFRN